MARWSLAVAFTLLIVTLGACSDGSGRDFCAAVGSTLPTLDAEDSPERWLALEAAADDSVRSDVRALRVVAEQIRRLGADADFEIVAALAVRPDVVEHLRRLADDTRLRCG
jgi:hypothetical protein